MAILVRKWCSERSSGASHLKAPQDVEQIKADLIPLPENTAVSLSLSENSLVLDGFSDIKNYITAGFNAYDLRELFEVQIQNRSKISILTEPGSVESGNVVADKFAISLVTILCSSHSFGWLFDWIPDAKLNPHIKLHYDSIRNKPNRWQTSLRECYKIPIGHCGGIFRSQN